MPAFCSKTDCVGWEVREDERFCSWCGARLVALEARLLQRLPDGEWQPVDTLLHGVRPALRLELRHAGQTGVIEVDSLDSSAPWLELEKQPLRLAPGEAAHVEVAAFHRLEDEDTVHEARLSAHGGDLMASALLQVVPVPGFEATLERTEVMLVRDEEVRLPLQVTLVRGRATVTGAPGLSVDWAEVEWADGFPQELDAQGRRTLHGLLRIPAAKATSLADGTPRRTATLALPGTGCEVTLELRFQASPELVVDPFRGRSRFDWALVRGATDRRKLVLTLHNGFERKVARAPLVVRGLEVTGPSPRPEVEGSLPLTLEAGQEARLALRLPEDAPPQGTWTLAFDTNELRPRRLHLAVQVREPLPYPGWLVVDLGTTHTCAALVDESRAVTMVELDATSPEGACTLRSAVAYQKLVESRKYRAGWLVWKGYVDLARAAVLNAKRRAGDRSFRFDVVPLEEPEHTVGVPVRDALADLYRHVVRRAAEGLAATGRADLALSRLVLTHPSRFATGQVEDLRQAARQALEEHLAGLGVEVPVEDRLLHEPVAACLDFLHEARSHAPVHEERGSDAVTWHALVYDAGGGTTDLTVVRVESRRRDGQYRVKARVLSAAGHARFGGEEMTAAVRDLLVERILETPGRVLPREPGEVPLHQELAARRNRSVLALSAEVLKIALSRGEAGTDLDEGWLSLWSGEREERRPLRDLVGRWPTREEVDARLSAELARTVRLARDMLRNAGVERPDCLLLVGQASRWPRVRELLEAEFPGVRLELPDDAKACVVRGAALFPRLGPRVLTGPGVRVEVEGSGEITTSRLGLQADTWGQPSFLELIPAGVEIPEAGRTARFEGLGLEVGVNEIRVLENAGVDDRLQGNPDVAEVRRLSFEIPPSEGVEDAAVEFHLSPTFQLSVKVLVAGLPEFAFEPIEGSEYGRRY